ncbi:hypothetical protein ABD77_16915 [Brevibacillus formosus]|nr:hypothetical protein [Brevibacillus formosus]
MKLKFPAIYSYAEMGSRGAWTGNSLLLRSFWLFIKSAQGKNVWVNTFNLWKISLSPLAKRSKSNTYIHSCPKALSHVWKETART